MSTSNKRAAMRKQRQDVRKQSVKVVIGNAGADDAKKIKDIYITYGHEDAAEIHEHNKQVIARGSRHQRRQRKKANHE